MHEKLLIDEVYEKILGGWERSLSSVVPKEHQYDLRRHVGNLLKEYRIALEHAERYVLGNSLVRRILHAEYPAPEQIGGLISAAKPQHYPVWLEYDNHYKVSVQSSEFYMPGQMTDQTPTRVGWLLVSRPERPDVWKAISFIKDSDGEIMIFPLVLIMNSALDGEPWEGSTGIPIANPNAKKTWDQWRGVCWGYRDDRGEYYPPPMVHDGFSLGYEPIFTAIFNASQPPTIGKDLALVEYTKIFVEQSGGDAPFICTFLALLNEVPVTVQIPRRTEGTVRSVYKGDAARPYLESKVVTVELPKRVRATYLSRQLERVMRAHVRKRWHLVSGHERVLFKGTEAERAVRVKPHARGDKRVGIVQKTHLAVDSGEARKLAQAPEA